MSTARIDATLLARQQRDHAALMLRSQGLSYAEMAEQLGCSRSTAHRRTERAIVEEERMLIESPEDRRQMELLKLGRMEKSLAADVVTGAPAAVRTLLRILELRKFYYVHWLPDHRLRDAVCDGKALRELFLPDEDDRGTGEKTHAVPAAPMRHRGSEWNTAEQRSNHDMRRFRCRRPQDIVTLGRKRKNFRRGGLKTVSLSTDARKNTDTIELVSEIENKLFREE